MNFRQSRAAKFAVWRPSNRPWNRYQYSHLTNSSRINKASTFRFVKKIFLYGCSWNLKDKWSWCQRRVSRWNGHRSINTVLIISLWKKHPSKGCRIRTTRRSRVRRKIRWLQRKRICFMEVTQLTNVSVLVLQKLNWNIVGSFTASQGVRWVKTTRDLDINQVLCKLWNQKLTESSFTT